MNFHTMTSKEAENVIYSLAPDTHSSNKLSGAKKKSLLHRFILQFSDFMIIILLIAAGISFCVSFAGKDSDFVDPIIILVIVVLNAILGVIEEYKADSAIRALQKISAPSALIRRSGKTITVCSEDVRVGDILILRAGNCVSADARLIQSADLETDESSLTGEAMPVAKDADCVLDEFTPLAERKNMIFAGTSVLRGKAEAIVTAIGMNTEMGKIAAILSAEDSEPTPLQKKLAETGKYLGIGALSICAVIFFMGILRHLPPFTMFLTSVSLAVAAIPEGLPAIVTIVLAIGVQKMAKKKAVVKHLSAVEALGSATVICADKTGTLTQNQMSVTKTIADDRQQLLEMAAICCDSAAIPTEKAIIDAAAAAGIDKDSLDSLFPRIDERPFDSKRKLMSVMIHYYNQNRIITKGAAEILLKKCSHFIENGVRCELTDVQRERIFSDVCNLGEQALRVIGVAYRDIPYSHISENNLTFIGLIGMMDPPRPEVRRAVSDCITAGIRPVMITGDNKTTAIAIAAQTGFSGNAVTGDEMRSKSDGELTSYNIFARVTPSDKMRIVKAFKKQGEIVAMTGDGVNDAPALKSADIGCSMGLKGTDVAKEASDLILADDNFASIVSAVREGRGIFENIKKSIQFLLSSNIGEIMVVFIGMLFGWEPLLAIQLLWVNLVTDSLPALALGLDPVDADIMQRMPRNPKKSLFADGLWLSICLEGSMIGALVLLAYAIGMFFFDPPHTAPVFGRTMAFCVLSMSQLFHAFNMRSEHSILKSGIFKNPVLILSLIIGITMQILVVNTTFLSSIFKVSTLSPLQWFIVALLSVMPIAIVELQKAVSRHFEK